MSWRWRKRVDPPQARPIEENPRMITTSDELQRAETAARVAALHLESAQARRPEVDRKAAAIVRATRENGFAELMKQAFGS